MGWLVFGLYGFGWLVTLLPLYRIIEDGEDCDQLEQGVVGVLAAVLALFWPAAIVVALAFRVSRRIWGEREQERVS